MGTVPPADPPLTETLARLLRHEVGDLLQVVYSFVGLMQERIPPEGLERRLLTDLKGRAETCRQELDAAVDLVCPLTVQPTTLDLSALTTSLVGPLRRRFSTRQIDVVAPGPVSVIADPQRLSGALSLLVAALCQEAARQVQVEVGRDRHPESGVPWAAWAVRRDGLPPAPEQLAWLEHPFSTTRYALFGLAIALTRRVAEAHGGRLVATTFPEGGIEMRVLLPAVVSGGENG